MRSLNRYGTRGLLATVLVAAGFTVTSSTATAAAVPINLCAVAGTLALPGGPDVPVWGFGTPGTPGDCSTATPGLPGPVLDVTEGDVVTLHVTNALPGTRDLRLEIPGVSFAPGDVVAGPGDTVDLTFTADLPGTYLYRSTGDAGRQQAMGLYGALLVRSATSGQAYGTPGTAYDRESVLVLSALDPAFNADPDGADLNDYLATYWMINGRAYPDTLPGITVPVGQRLLLRYLNAGFDHTTMALHGLHEHVVARDARLVPSAFDACAETIPAGATEDAIITMPSTAPPVTAGFPLLQRQLHLTNGATDTDPTPTPGGMLTFLHP